MMLQHSSPPSSHAQKTPASWLTRPPSSNPPPLPSPSSPPHPAAVESFSKLADSIYFKHMPDVGPSTAAGPASPSSRSRSRLGASAGAAAVTQADGEGPAEPAAAERASTAAQGGNDGPLPELWVNQLVASSVRWRELRLVARQEAGGLQAAATLGGCSCVLWPMGRCELRLAACQEAAGVARCLIEEVGSVAGQSALGGPPDQGPAFAVLCWDALAKHVQPVNDACACSLTPPLLQSCMVPTTQRSPASPSTSTRRKRASQRGPPGAATAARTAGVTQAACTAATARACVGRRAGALHSTGASQGERRPLLPLLLGWC